MKKPHLQLDMQPLTVKNLYDEDVYIKMIDAWYSHYQSINKIRLQSFTKEIMNDTKLLERQLILKGLEAYGGEQEFLKLIERAKAEDKFTNRMQSSRLKLKIQSISQDKVLTEESELIIELDQKVKQAAQFYR